MIRRIVKLDKEYLVQSEKRKEKLKCFEARIDRGDELSFNHDRTRLSSRVRRDPLESAILPCAKESGFTRRSHSQHQRNETNAATTKRATS